MRRTAPHLFAIVLGLALCALAAAAHADTPPAIVFTADTEGHVGPCGECPMHVGNGGLARRATLVKGARGQNDQTLLLDAGNSLFGPDSADSRGKVVAAAYAALGYDAVNLGPKDFRYGKAHTQSLVRDNQIVAVSASIESDGRPLFAPYVVKTVGGKRIAIVGVCEPPPGMNFLPHLKEQLAGLSIRPAKDALAEWLPKARSESDGVIVLYYGSVAGLDAIDKQFGGDLLAIGVGGIRPDQLPAGTKAATLASDLHGKSLATLRAAGGNVSSLTQIAVSPDVAPDPAMEKLLAESTAAARPVEKPRPMVVIPPASTPTSQALASAPSTRPVVESPVVTTPSVATPSPATLPTTPPPVVATAAPEAPKDAVKRVPARQERKPQGLAGVGLSAEQVNRAIDRGGEFLYKHLQATLEKEHRKLGESYVGPDLLTCLALVHAGVHRKNPEFDKQLHEFLRGVDPVARMPGTYENGVLSLLIESLGDPTFLPLLQQSFRRLIEQQGAKGSWGYEADLKPADFTLGGEGKVLRALGGRDPDAPTPGIEFKRNTTWDRGKDGDNSTTQFALLGLRAGSRCGFKSPAETWRRVLEETRRRQCVDGGWHYETPSVGYGSMTCAGICTLAIARHELGEVDAAADEGIERGLAWLSENFAVDKNPQQGTGYQYYYLYSLERVGRLLDTEFIGPNEWYPLGAKYLVDAQRPDGRWVESNDEESPVQPVSFALLFLTRATPTLAIDAPQRGGRGTLMPGVASPPPGQIYIILDASGSMLAEMNGRTKFDAARAAVDALLDGVPPGTQVALRVYGHRHRATDPEADQDTALEVPVAPLDRVAFDARLRSLTARGRTPLTYSLQQAQGEIASAASRSATTVLLLTDGGDDTRARGGAVEAAAAIGKIAGVTMQVVGFDIDADSVPQLTQMAAAGNGRYWPAEQAAELQARVSEAVLGIPRQYRVVDALGKPAGEGHFGTAISLPEGKYRLLTTFGGREFGEEFWVNTNAMTAVVFDAAEASRARGASPTTQSTLVPTVQPAAPDAATARPKFCTNCGAPLAPKAKFCTRCGTAVSP